MSSSPWSQYTPLGSENDIPQEINAWSQFTPLAPAQRNVPQLLTESLKGLGRIAGRGGASLLAAPSKGIGGLLELLSKIYPEDTGLRGAPQKGLSAAGRFFQETGKAGEEQLKGLIEDALGKSYGSGEEALAGFTERVGDIYGRGPFKGMGAAAALGGASGQIAKELGAPEGVQQAAELVGIASPDIGKGLKAIKGIEKITEKSGLVLPRVVEKTKEGFKLIKGKVFSKSKVKVLENVSKQSEELINSMKASEFPISVEIEKGIDVESRLSNDLEKVNKIASKMDQKIESSLISDYLNKVEEKISKTPVPTKDQEEILGLVSKFRKEFGEFEGKRFYTPSEYIRQFRNVNKDAKKLYEKAFIEGQKGEVRQFYRGFNKEIEKTLENGTPEAFSNLFKETNAQFHELQKLNTFEKILEDVTKNEMIDPKKFGNIFRSASKSKLLRKQVGDKTFDQMRLISKDLEKVKDKLGILDDIGVRDIVKSAAVGSILSKLGVVGKFGIPIQAGKKVSELSYGYFLLNPKGQRDFKNFLKAVQSGNKKAVERYLKTMDKHALKEEKNQE